MDFNKGLASKPKALIIATCTAMSGFESGGSVRVHQIEKILFHLGFEIVKVCKKNAKTYLAGSENHALVVISSYSCASLGKLARRHATFLWFDPYDSWYKGRLTLIKAGSILQIGLLIRDMLFIGGFPKTELLTFVNRVDANIQWRFSKKRLTKVFPIKPEMPNFSHRNEGRVLFVGDGKYKPNRSCLAFLNQVGEQLDDKVFVVGKDYPKSKKFTHLVLLGYQDNSQIYNSQDIHLVPIKDGPGIKTKAIIPLMAGLPVIAFPEVAKPFKILPNLWTAESPTEFAAIIKHCRQSKNLLNFNADIYVTDETLCVMDTLKKFSRMVS